jgi:hypothetical protein
MQQNNSIYWSSRLAQHVSDKTVSIIRRVRLQITAYSMVSCCSGGLVVRRAAAWYYVLGVKEDTWLRQDTIPQAVICSLTLLMMDSFVRNMLSWSWRSINSVILLRLVGLILSNCLHWRRTVKHKSKKKSRHRNISRLLLNVVHVIISVL